MINIIDYVLLSGASHYDTRAEINRFPLQKKRSEIFSFLNLTKNRLSPKAGWSYFPLHPPPATLDPSALSGTLANSRGPRSNTIVAHRFFRFQEGAPETHSHKSPC
ncbi:MAG: hypothetical protein MK097_01385 [Dechloromonas sp.]|nr:hypothetical protein [Dechloromonas sp.]